MLEDGRLTDGQGHTVDFRNTVIAMTSNLGSEHIQRLAGRSDYAAMKESVMEAVKVSFRPEFINRIDEVVVFHPLEKGHIRAIAGIQIEALRERLAAQDVELEVSDSALDQLGEAGFDPVYGARPLKRAVQSRLGNELARRLLSGEIASGQAGPRSCPGNG